MSFILILGDKMIDKSKIYIGYNKNNKRCLLYGLDENKYKDLEEKTIYLSSDIYLSSLVRYSQLIDIHKDKCVFAKRFVNAYQKEENEIIDLIDVLIAPIYVITKVTEGKWHGSTYSALYKKELFKERELILRKHFIYYNLFNNQEYNSKFGVDEGDLRVEPQFAKSFVSEIGLKSATELPKRKILQLYVDKYGVE